MMKRYGIQILKQQIRFQSTTPTTPLKFKKLSLDKNSDFTATKIINQQLSQYNNLPLQLAITESASKKLHKLSEEEGKSNLALRLVVSSGGCHGFQYDLKITNTDEFKPENNDSLFERNGGKLIVDKDALEIMRDSKIDYVKELIGEGFKVIESPLTKSSCGCGSSFDVDFEKLEKLNPPEK
ncbi:Isa2 protein [Pichia kluyveri]|uniref:Isa2 protein n=1 Tax=Pichia kluyveri TaxID=36015 RepID=A0AAV5QYS2_PICKL|nr:Isa2 protein [Pichia kluyveri]